MVNSNKRTQPKESDVYNTKEYSKALPANAFQNPSYQNSLFLSSVFIERTLKAFFFCSFRKKYQQKKKRNCLGRKQTQKHIKQILFWNDENVVKTTITKKSLALKFIRILRKLKIFSCRWLFFTYQISVLNICWGFLCYKQGNW